MRDRRRPRRSTPPEEAIQAYWKRYAVAFAAPLRANGLVGRFVTNPAVTGAYAEAWIRRLAEIMVTGLRISTGAIIRTSDVVKGRDLRKVPQTDLIFWDPSELPPLFQSGDFALVHAQAARAIVEVKRTISSIEKFSAQLSKQRFRLFPEYRRNVLGVVIADSRRLFGNDVDAKWVERADPKQPVRMTRLLNRRTSKPDADGVFALIYFLSHIARNPKANLPPNPRP